MSKAVAKKAGVIGVRIDEDLRRRVEAAISAMPYHLTMTAIVVRGLELAIEEMHRFSKSAGAACSVNRNDMVGLREMNERHAPHLVGTSKAKQIEANQ